ncbi:MAG: TIGR00282 family metallophosphoesterase [Trueperaceae bacterium]|nr:TIGR00282 family metallophosphoesterase [Trueperaceae bacterium]
MHVLYIGDVFGAPGLRATHRFLRDRRDDFDVVVANGENAAGGFGITRKHAEQLWGWGVDVITLGNHTFDQADAVDVLESSARIVRPANYPPGTPGLGHTTVTARNGERLTVGQVMGRVFLDQLDDPFVAADAIVEACPPERALLVDVHAEATSEKKVLGYHLRGRASAVIGTHTHVQTADEEIVDGTAYLTDVGMTGVQHSSIGMQFAEVHARFTTKRPHRFRPAVGPATLCAVHLDLNGRRARAIERVQWRDDGASDDG